jgi:hypothetical protein
MNPIEFEGQNLMLNAPPGWNDTQPVKCGMLPAKRMTVQGLPAMVSYWKPEPQDLARLNAGGCVELVVYGNMHPPVWVDTAQVQADADRKPGVPI